MSLHDRHILIDGYNLEMPEGTGIKRYGIGLLRALQRGRAKVSVLSSVPAGQHQVEQESLIFDACIHRGPSRSELLGLGLAASVGFLPVRRFTPSHHVISDPERAFWYDFHTYYISHHCFALANRWFRLVRRPVSISLRPRPDLWHATTPLPIRIRGVPKVTTVHDVVPLRLPWATLDDKRFFYRLVKHSLEDSDLVVTISESTKADLVELFGVPADRIEVTYQTVSRPTRRLGEEELARRLRFHGLEPDRYALFVGALEPKKNIGRLLSAFGRARTDLTLVLVGPKGWLYEKDLEKGKHLRKQRRLAILGFLPDSELAALYQGARAFVFPSVYEGFGLPPLEALSYGCPVLTSRDSSLPEVCGDAALYVDPFDVDELAAAIDTILHDETARERLRRANAVVQSAFDEETHLRRLEKAYGRVL